MSRVNDLLSDPWVAAEIERALAPYVGRLPAEQLAWMRAELAETLKEEPSAAKLLARARPRSAVDESGEVACDPPIEEGVARRRSTKAG